MLVRERLQHLKTIGLFGSFGEKELRVISKVALCWEVRKGEVLFSPGDRADKVYFLAEGGVTIVRPGERGKRAIIAFVKPGALFGERSIVAEGVMANRAEVAKDGVVCHMASRTFRRFLARRPALALRVAQVITKRAQALENRVAGLILKDVTTRLVELLLDLFREQGVPCRHGYAAEVVITRYDLADLVGAARPTISSVLNMLKRMGLIHLAGRAICFLDRERLRALATGPSVM